MMFNLSLLTKIAEAFIAKFLRALPQNFRVRRNNNSSSDNNSNDHKSNDPFELLGLEGGKENSTIEEATKARRKLALKWHPGRSHHG
mmetsp:Transcript_10484/g.18453  ORF Transcript_10484/g.18453 Transcript_10484/m.18453 type:complete len:87 (-) Transcript_10484:2032-2292(-)